MLVAIVLLAVLVAFLAYQNANVVLAVLLKAVLARLQQPSARHKLRVRSTPQGACRFSKPCALAYASTLCRQTPALVMGCGERQCRLDAPHPASALPASAVLAHAPEMTSRWQPCFLAGVAVHGLCLGQSELGGPLDLRQLDLQQLELRWPGWRRPVVLGVVGLSVEVQQRQMPHVSAAPRQGGSSPLVCSPAAHAC